MSDSIASSLELLATMARTHSVLLERYDASIRKRALMEFAMVTRACEALIAAGYFITVDDGEEESVMTSQDVVAIVNGVFAVDEATLYVVKDLSTITTEAPGSTRGYDGWIRLVMGNDGWDTISDYSTNLEEALKPANDLSDQLSEFA